MDRMWKTCDDDCVYILSSSNSSHSNSEEDGGDEGQDDGRDALQQQEPHREGGTSDSSKSSRYSATKTFVSLTNAQRRSMGSLIKSALPKVGVRLKIKRDSETSDGSNPYISVDEHPTVVTDKRSRSKQQAASPKIDEDLCIIDSCSDVEEQTTSDSHNTDVVRTVSHDSPGKDPESAVNNWYSITEVKHSQNSFRSRQNKVSNRGVHSSSHRIHKEIGLDSTSDSDSDPHQSERPVKRRLKKRSSSEVARRDIYSISSSSNDEQSPSLFSDEEQEEEEEEEEDCFVPVSSGKYSSLVPHCDVLSRSKTTACSEDLSQTKISGKSLQPVVRLELLDVDSLTSSKQMDSYGKESNNNLSVKRKEIKDNDCSTENSSRVIESETPRNSRHRQSSNSDSSPCFSVKRKNKFSSAIQNVGKRQRTEALDSDSSSDEFSTWLNPKERPEKSYSRRDSLSFVTKSSASRSSQNKTSNITSTCSSKSYVLDTTLEELLISGIDSAPSDHATKNSTHGNRWPGSDSSDVKSVRIRRNRHLRIQSSESCGGSDVCQSNTECANSVKSVDAEDVQTTDQDDVITCNLSKQADNIGQDAADKNEERTSIHSLSPEEPDSIDENSHIDDEVCKSLLNEDWDISDPMEHRTSDCSEEQETNTIENKLEDIKSIPLQTKLSTDVLDRATTSRARCASVEEYTPLSLREYMKTLENEKMSDDCLAGSDDKNKGKTCNEESHGLHDDSAQHYSQCFSSDDDDIILLSDDEEAGTWFGALTQSEIKVEKDDADVTNLDDWTEEFIKDIDAACGMKFDEEDQDLVKAAEDFESTLIEFPSICPVAVVEKNNIKQESDMDVNMVKSKTVIDDCDNVERNHSQTESNSVLLNDHAQKQFDSSLTHSQQLVDVNRSASLKKLEEVQPSDYNLQSQAEHNSSSADQIIQQVKISLTEHSEYTSHKQVISKPAANHQSAITEKECNEKRNIFESIEQDTPQVSYVDDKAETNIDPTIGKNMTSAYLPQSPIVPKNHDSNDDEPPSEDVFLLQEDPIPSRSFKEKSPEPKCKALPLKTSLDHVDSGSPSVLEMMDFEEDFEYEDPIPVSFDFENIPSSELSSHLSKKYTKQDSLIIPQTSSKLSLSGRKSSTESRVDKKITDKQLLLSKTSKTKHYSPVKRLQQSASRKKLLVSKPSTSKSTWSSAIFKPQKTLHIPAVEKSNSEQQKDHESKETHDSSESDDSFDLNKQTFYSRKRHPSMETKKKQECQISALITDKWQKVGKKSTKRPIGSPIGLSQAIANAKAEKQKREKTMKKSILVAASSTSGVKSRNVIEDSNKCSTPIHAVASNDERTFTGKPKKRISHMKKKIETISIEEEQESSAGIAKSSKQPFASFDAKLKAFSSANVSREKMDINEQIEKSHVTPEKSGTSKDKIQKNVVKKVVEQNKETQNKAKPQTDRSHHDNNKHNVKHKENRTADKTQDSSRERRHSRKQDPAPSHKDGGSSKYSTKETKGHNSGQEGNSRHSHSSNKEATSKAVDTSQSSDLGKSSTNPGITQMKSVGASKPNAFNSKQPTYKVTAVDKNRQKGATTTKRDGDIFSILNIKSPPPMKPAGNTHHHPQAAAHAQGHHHGNRQQHIIGGQGGWSKDRVIQQILKWPPAWFEEYNKVKAMPPIVSKKSLVPLLETYDSYDDYVQIMTPHFLLECWYQMYNKWKETSRTDTWVRVSLLPVHLGLENPGTDTKAHTFMDLACQGILSRSDVMKGRHAQEGDIVKVNLKFRDQANQMQVKVVSGFVQKALKLGKRNHSIHKTIAGKLIKEPEGSMVQHLEIKLLFRKIRIAETEFFNLEVFDSITSNLRQYEALLFLPRSLLARDILNPANQHVFVGPEVAEDPDLQKKFNDSQAKAMNTIAAGVLQPYALPKIYLLQGPPGTGKSHVIAGLIERILTQGLKSKQSPRILLCAPSNGAVDELARRLIRLKSSMQKDKRSCRLDFVRFGKMSVIHPDVCDYSLDSTFNQKWKKYHAKDRLELSSVRTALSQLENKLKGCYTARENLQKNGSQTELRNLDNEIDKLEKKKSAIDGNPNRKDLSAAEEHKIKKMIFLDSQVVCCTLNTAGSSQLKGYLCPDPREVPFHCVIVDEAAQCIELDTLIPLQYGCSKFVLVGDPEQLPPTVISKEAQDMNYGQSIFERYYGYFKMRADNPIMMLTTQYRMHSDICHFPNSLVYWNRLRTDKDIARERDKHFSLKHYAVFDVAYGQEYKADEKSVCNGAEASFVGRLCRYLLRHVRHLRPDRIGIITPYKKQKQVILDEIRGSLSRVEVGTVDGFQGREKDVVIVSCVRAGTASNSIGFLADVRRMNVALTRAKYACYVVGHAQTLKIDKNWKRLVDDAKERDVLIQSRRTADDDRAFNWLPK